MKNIRFLLPLFLAAAISACSQKPDCNTLLEQTQKSLDSGNLTLVKLLADSIRKECPGEKQLVARADSLSLIAERIPVDFSLSEEQFDMRLQERIGSYTAEEKKEWDQKGWLEWRLLNGEKKYFNRAASNLALIRNFHFSRAHSDSVNSLEPDIILQRLNTESIIKVSTGDLQPVIPVEMIIEYSIIIDPDAVPEGKTVRCWLPYPKENNPRQTEVKFISASQPAYRIASDTAVHRTVYMEAAAKKGIPLTFSVSYSYKSSGQYIDLSKIGVLPYNKSSAIYRNYTSEQLPQINFTENVKRLADSITGSETDPMKIIRKIYYWFSNNIPWAGAQEYSIMQDIPGYVIRNRRGDCGMQTFLFMSMLRYKGIPVRWQSGWKMTPGAKNLHDWSEVYLEGPGWIPVDISYGLQYSPDIRTREFFMSGIDSYRLIVNDGVSGTLIPEKKYMRSEPFDFQRGEVEWEGGNLYFDKWDYDMKITYKK